MAGYIHERSDWPFFRWDAAALATLLADVRFRQGRLLGRMEALDMKMQLEANVEACASTIVCSSAIEGEVLDYDRVRSSVSRNLGVGDGSLYKADRSVEGVVEMTIDATENCAAPLTQERLFAWHAALFPTGYNGLRKIAVAEWRGEETDPMRVASGSGLRERIHFEAPAAKRLPSEMRAFLEWVESPHGDDPLLRAGVAHLYLATLHPFADGNGRISRAVADLCLARSERGSRRFYSISSEISRKQSTYYHVLEAAQRGTMDVTRWLEWFARCVGNAVDASGDLLERVLKMDRIWRVAKTRGINDRQRVVLTRLLGDFENNLTSGKYAKLAKCSHDTALRDIETLIRHGILARNDAGGRSTSYRLNDARGTCPRTR